MDVRDLGAYGDGSHDDYKAIQAALDQNDGRVVIPEGVYKIGDTLRICSNTHLVVHPAARLYFADGVGVNSQSFLLTNQNHDEGDSNIHIEGGIWDGNNINNPRGNDETDSYTGALINFINVVDLSIQRLTVMDAEAYFIRLEQVKGFVISDIHFETQNLRLNQDGVHLGGYCEDGIIRDLVGVGNSTNDDLVALNADDALNRVQNLDLKCGPIRNIRVQNLKADSCHTFVRLLSVHSPISDIHVENIQGGCRCMVLNLDACRECRVKLFDPEDPRYQDGVGDIRNVHIQNLYVHKSDPNDSSPLINLRTNVCDFRVEDFQRNPEQDVHPTAPTLAFSDCRASWMILDGITIQQVEMLKQSEGVRHKIVQKPNLPSDEANFRAQIDIDHGCIFQLPQGGFSILSLNPKE